MQLEQLHKIDYTANLHPNGGWISSTQSGGTVCEDEDSAKELRNIYCTNLRLPKFPPRAFKLRRSGLLFKISQVQKSC